MKFYKNEEIEILAESRLVELEKILGKPLSPPIPIDTLAENILGLDFLWEKIDELPGEEILGGLIPKERKIILNESRRVLFEEKPGLERSTKGHEMGHWDLFFSNIPFDHPTLFDSDMDGVHTFRNSSIGNVAVLKALLSCQEGIEFLAKISSRADEADEARAVNRYAAAISMPRKMISEEVKKINRTEWKNLYAIAKRYEVTISALRVRLEQLNLLYVSKNGTLFESKDQALGQETFGF